MATLQRIPGGLVLVRPLFRTHSMLPLSCDMRTSVRLQDAEAIELCAQVRLHFSFQDDECLYLVMEYVPGGGTLISAARH